jgi:amino-acid N-acetyltransferase
MPHFAMNKTCMDDHQQETQQASFVNWFRDSSPYIHAHRNCTFVISFSGEAVNDTSFASHVHDFALLNSLGIRLVLVHGIRPQIDERLKKLNITPEFHRNLRITDDQALQCVKEAAGLVRVEIEALLSMGLSNSPMAGAKIRVSSGNFVTAKPLGVLDGIDYCHTGTVRRIDTSAIQQQLDLDNVLLISPTGYSPSGEIFNLCAEKVATEVAIALQAEKLVLLTEESCHNPDNKQPIRQMTTTEAEAFLSAIPDLPERISLPLTAAIHGCQQGIYRAHLVDRNINGALLLELFTRDGIGTLISSNPYEELRIATINDIPGILELIIPLEQQGKLIPRSHENLEMNINDYLVIDRDGLIIGCTALHQQKDRQTGEIACLAVHKDYQNSARGSHLLKHIFNKARELQLTRLYVLSTQTMHWFIERGFKQTDLAQLPASLNRPCHRERNSKILYKNL